jgi:predicted porin
LSGLKISAGIFEGVLLQGGGYGTTRTLRPEAELAYDFSSPSFNTHIFANGAFQNVHVQQTDLKSTMYGAGYGGRFEFGPVHLGAAGHYGKGVGLTYAFDGSATVSSSFQPPMPEPPIAPALRTMSGFVGFAQLVAGQFDFNLAAGQTQVKRASEDSNIPDSVIKTQTGISAGVVYHISENLHFDVDFLNTSFAWSGGEKQKVNFINTGVTMTF